MKTAALFVAILSFAFSVYSQNISVVPQPKSVKPTAGDFRMTTKTKIVAFDETGRKTAGLLNDLLIKQYGFKLEFTDKPQKTNAIIIGKQLPPDKQTAPESYNLEIAPRGIWIYGTETGQFYALQTLMQILPAEFKGSATLPGALIEDEPRFKYRGMHLDVSRHFMPVSFVKKYIDLLAMYKFNQFHWHLTDDQGWRIEIKKYPKLTSVASKRPETMIEKNFNPYKGDGIPVEGFYTQDEIRDVVAYAKARKINVIPEIELPGHASAALAAYPELGCKQDFNYKIQTTWGIFKEVFCPTETTFKFLDDVLEETIALFPDSPYIHIGGDEVLKDHWKESPFVQDLMKRENLKDEHEVQSFFIRRMEKFVNSKGRIIIGWDEILEGGLAPNAVVMSWRGEKGGIEAAKAKHNVIMTPTTALYFDYGQGDPKTEPLNIGGYLPLETVYNYNPIPKELTADEAKYVLGAQANLWTEYIKTPEKVEYMVFPRMLALSEVVWSPHETKNLDNFKQRLPQQFARLDRMKVNYRIPPPEGLTNQVVSEQSSARVELRSLVAGSRILYTTDGSTPDENSAVYSKPIDIPLSANQRVELKTIVVTSSGRKSAVYPATLMRREMLSPAAFTPTKQTINVSFFKGMFSSVKQLDTATVTETFESKTLLLAQFADRTDKSREPFGVIFDGYLNVPADGIYEFELESDDGAQFIIGEEAVVDLDGPHAKMTATGIVPLRKGFHKVRIKYFQAGGDAALGLRWAVKGTGYRRLTGADFAN